MRAAEGGLVQAAEGGLVQAAEGGTEPAFSSPAEAFAYLHQVARHARCVNCHGTYGADGLRRPTVGDGAPAAIHPMNVTERHNPDRPALGITCTSCHGPRNSPDAGGPPGVADGCPSWQMPTRRMTVLSPAISKQELCAKWRDAVQDSLKREPLCPGPRASSAAEFFVGHITEDHLIEWAFAPGPGRAPAPGSFERLKAAARTWAPALEDPRWCESLSEPRR